MKMVHNVREALEYSAEELDKKAKEAFAADNIPAFDRFTDAKFHIMRAINTITAEAPYNYKEVLGV